MRPLQTALGLNPTSMTRIVTTTYRYKRPPRKRKPVALEVPTIVRAAKPSHDRAAAEASRRLKELMKPDEPEKAPEVASPAIVTARRSGARLVSDLTPEEHKRRGDAADALFREMKRAIAEKDRKEQGP